jgi:hypothetical protein
MNVVLHEIAKREDGLLQLCVSCDADSPRAYLACYHGDNPQIKECTLHEELFMMLSEAAHKRFGNCTVYQMELMGIIGAFAEGHELPRLPATLGMTRFCSLKPGFLTVIWNKLWILLHNMGLYQPRVWTHPDYRSPA